MKHTIYFIGGPSRTGKTIVAMKLFRRKRLIAIPTDVIRAGIRKVLIGEAHVNVGKISFTGSAEFRRPGKLKIYKIRFTQKGKSQDDLAWDAVLGMLDAYDRKNVVDVLVEGIAVTPERVHRLKLKNLAVKAVFIGVGDMSHVAVILKYAKKEKDWVYTWIREKKGNDAHVHAWVRKYVKKNDAVKKAAKKFGYGYFDVTKRPFAIHTRTIIQYLLKT